MINDPLKYVAVPYAELQALLEMARNVSKNSPWGQSDTQPWNPEIKQLAELGDEVPTIAGVIGESNTVLISMPDFEAIKQLMPVIGINNNWWVNGIDTGVSAVPDNTKVLRPPMMVRLPAVSATENQDEILISGGVVTVYNGVGSVLEINIPDTILNVYNKKMVVINSLGVVTAQDTTDAIVNAVPILYCNHPVHSTVNVTTDITFAMTASELSYAVKLLSEVDAGLYDKIQTLIDNAIVTINNLITEADQIAINRLRGVPRVLSFNAMNESGYVSGSTIAYFMIDHAFVFPDNFAGSYAAFTLKYGITELPEVSLLGIFVTTTTGVKTRIGSMQINLDGTCIFVMYQTGYSVHAGEKLSFEADTMGYIGSVSLTLVHTLEV